MSDSKVKPPKTLSHRVVRPHLLAQLDGQEARALTLITAEAGAGKTSLLQQWAECQSIPVAWVSMADEDNDPAIFLHAVITALRKAAVDLSDVASSLLSGQSTMPVETVMRTLINAIELESKPCALVLDDYHVIENDTVHRAVGYLVDHLPSELRLLIASRAEPALPLARLRVRGQLNDLGPRDMQFSLGEAEQLLNGLHQLGIPPAELEQLLASTEGWAAGLQFVALAVRNRSTVADVLGLFHQNRHVVDFLAEEVFSRLSAEVRTFLLMTSVLNRFSAPLCDAVTQRTNSAVMLAEALRQNLFVIPLEGKTAWYRYHRLFAEFLLSRLERTSPDLVPDLHLRAAAWLEANGYLSQAVQHLLAAGDAGGAARAIEAVGRSMLERGEAKSVLTWLGRLPEGEILARPALCLVRAWAHVDSGQVEAGQRWLDEAEKGLAPERWPVAPGGRSARALKGEIAALRCRLPIYRHEAAPSLQWARTALSCLPEHDSPLRLGVQLNLGLHYYYRLGDLSRASRAFSECARLSVAGGNPETGLFSLSYLGWVRVSQGRLRQAGDVYQHALQVARDLKWDLTPTSGIVHVSMASLLLEWHELEEAERYLQEGMRRGEQGGVLQVLTLGCREQIRQHLAGGEYDRVGEPLRRLRTLGAGATADFWAAVAAFLQGDVRGAQAWAADAGFGPTSAPKFDNVVRFAFYGDVLVGLGEPDLALQVAGKLREFATASGWSNFTIRADLLSAVAHDARGSTRASVAAVASALDRAAPEGGVWQFLSRGRPLARVLANYLIHRQHTGAHSGSVAHARRLLTILSASSALQPAPGSSESLHLSGRELEILRLVAAGDSNEDIARRLFVTVGTVKTHIHRIYGKLEVRSRTQAIARARSQGLLG